MKRGGRLRRRTPLRHTAFRPKPPASELRIGKSEVRARVTTIRPRSAKLARQMRAYVPEMLAFLAERPWCERCGAPTECLHHKRGREGARLRDQRWWAASCLVCNDFAETDTGQARAEGWLLPFDLPKEAA